MKPNYRHTMIACFVGYIVQAIVNNFVPLLFLTFQDSYGIPLAKITLLVTFNFAIQLMVDLLSALFVDRLGYRRSMILAHVCAAVGFILLTILPEVMDPFTGILISIVVYAIGGGLLEVLVSPIVEACPVDDEAGSAAKERAMSLLHSFYCWGHVGVVLLSTAFFALCGIQNWKWMARIWAIVPVVNMFAFMKVPIAALESEGEKGLNIRELFGLPVFWILFVMMLCAGASEQAVSQWASTFAELGLGVTKTVGDLAGPLSFAVLMGTSRAFYGKFGEKLNLDRFMIGSTFLCIAAYLGISLFPVPALSLVCCALCGLSVGIFWPGTFSKAARALPGGGTAMYAFLALAGDVGCSGGPTVVGFLSDAFGGDLKKGILCAIVFPIMMLVSILALAKKSQKKEA